MAGTGFRRGYEAVVTGLALAPFLRTDAIRRLRDDNAAASGQNVVAG